MNTELLSKMLPLASNRKACSSGYTITVTGYTIWHLCKHMS